MAMKKEDLLKFSKSTELAIKLIEDDSSGGTADTEGTEVKILHLVKEVLAVGSNPTPDGGEMRVKGTKVYVASDNIDEMLKDLVEQDGILVYKGPMHLDVSKPSGRVNAQSGQFEVTKPAKIWLTKTKFSRNGGQLRNQQREKLSSFTSTFFGKGIIDLTAETATASTDTNTSNDGAKVEPEVVVGARN